VTALRRLRVAWSRRHATQGAPRQATGERPTRRQRSDDGGYTLIEVLIAVSLFGLLLGMAIPVIETLFQTTTYVNNSYSNENQLLPIGTTFQSLIRSVVEPDPNLSSGQPVPAYGTYTANNGTNNVIAANAPTPSSVTFFTNIGDTNGPAEVVAAISGSTFTVSVAHATTTTCPGVSTGSACTWGTPKALITVKNVVSTSIFTYTVDVGGTLTPYSTASADTTEFQTCNSTTCPANEIESVKVNLEVNVAPNDAGQAQDDTVVYELSPISQAYQPEVG
jgi:prepilin-type N-terminal cleavage/methylation domain-containing protein